MSPRSPWPLVLLGEVAEFVRGVTFKPSDLITADDSEAVACMRTKNVQEQLDGSDLLHIPRRLVKRQEQFLCHGDTLVSSANSWNLLGKCCWVPEEFDGCTFGGFISVLRPAEPNISKRYLYRWFNSPEIQCRLRSFGRRTTNISNLPIGRCLKDLHLPLPPIEEQRRIAAILDEADELGKKRAESLTKLDTLKQSIFISMFGDPVTGRAHHEVGTLCDLGELNRGKSKHRPRNDPRLLGGDWPLIQTGDVANSGGFIKQFSTTYSDLGLAQSQLWPTGTLCITIAANIAKTGILTFDACFPDSVVGFCPGTPGDEHYVQVLLSFLQPMLESSAPESAQKNINLKILRELPIPIPPVELRSLFANRLAALQGQIESLATSQLQLETLFASLQQEAFAGRL